MKKLLVLAFTSISLLAANAYADLPDFTQLVEKQSAAVVLVSTEATVQMQASPFGNMQDDPMAEWFRRFGFFDNNRQQRPQKSKGLGSGFVIDADGYILTNAHVVDKADDITVKFPNKRELKAEVVGMDKRSDVALLKVKADHLQTVTIGSPDKLKVGAWVVAIGASLGWENTVTAGIVSAKERLFDDDNVVPFIQHTAPINQGNSGGPLFNSQGEVIGINSRIYTPNQGFVGLSFSIPIDLAMNVVKQIKDNGKVSRGRLGVALQPMSEALASSFGLDKTQGTIVAQVTPDSAADKAGIKVGDVIVALNGTTIDKPADLSRLIASSRGGQQVKLEIIRDKKSRTIAVILDEGNDDNASASLKPSKKNPKGEGSIASVGLVLAPLSDVQLKKLKLDFGLYVQEARGPAQEAGLQAGDVFVGVIGQTVQSLADFEKALKANTRVAVQVRRGDSVFFAPLDIPAAK